MERYLSYLINIVAGSPDGRIQPVYGIDGRAQLIERDIDSLPGYRNMGPVRIGNQACEQIQHDVYGSAILAVAHVFLINVSFTEGSARCSHAWRISVKQLILSMIIRIPTLGNEK